MKNEKGITLLSLVITVMIMLILSAVGIKYGINSYQGIKLKNFAYELEQIQGAVDAKHEEMITDDIDFTAYGQDISESNDALGVLKKVKRIHYSTLQNNNTNSYSNGKTKYRYFSKNDLKKVFDIKSPKLNVIINMETREVISVIGQKLDGVTYYTVKDI